MKKTEITIFGYEDYRKLLADQIAARLADNPRLSFRSFAKKAGFGSPNYFQQLIKGQRNLSPEAASKAAEAVGFTGLARKFFVALVALDATSDLGEKAALTGQIRQFVLLSKRTDVVDADIHGHWLHAVIYELATMKDFELSVDSAFARLSGIATRKEIQDSIAFLTDRRYLVKTKKAGRYRQEPVYLSPFNDVQVLSLRQCHFKFLDLAKDQLSRDVSEREFQNLTMAISGKRLGAVKARLREFINDLRQELADDPDADEVIHIECCAFKLT